MIEKLLDIFFIQKCCILFKQMVEFKTFVTYY